MSTSSKSQGNPQHCPSTSPNSARHQTLGLVERGKIDSEAKTPLLKTEWKTETPLYHKIWLQIYELMAEKTRKTQKMEEEIKPGM